MQDKPIAKADYCATTPECAPMDCFLKWGDESHSLYLAKIDVFQAWMCLVSLHCDMLSIKAPTSLCKLTNIINEDLCRGDEDVIQRFTDAAHRFFVLTGEAHKNYYVYVAGGLWFAFEGEATLVK